MTVHEPEVLRRLPGCASGRNGLADHFINFGPVVAVQADEYLGVFRRIADSPWDELPELVVRKQHGINRLADNHACGRLVCELRIETVSEPAKKLHRFREVLDRQIDENQSGHVDSSYCLVD
ncbi:MAG: hypothetical protein K1X57_07980 [Gemmataceae bacterium]|nr:hypothetical protein [Gemmataceae bacterium]